MPKEQYVITSSCWFDRRSHEKGSIIELDIDDPIESQKIALLNINGRIVKATRENVEAIKLEIKREEANDERLSKLNRTRPALAPA